MFVIVPQPTYLDDQNGEVEKRDDGFPLLSLPYPAMGRVLSYLTKEEIGKLRMVSPEVSKMVLRTDPSTRRWTIHVFEDKQVEAIMKVLVRARMKGIDFELTFIKMGRNSHDSKQMKLLRNFRYENVWIFSLFLWGEGWVSL